MIQDLLECRKNGWKERHAKDGPHKLGTSKNNAAAQHQVKNDTQYRRDQERNMARERQRQVVRFELNVVVGDGGVQDPRQREANENVKDVTSNAA